MIWVNMSLALNLRNSGLQKEKYIILLNDKCKMSAMSNVCSRLLEVERTSVVRDVRGTFPRVCGTGGTRILRGIKLRMEKDILDL